MVEGPSCNKIQDSRRFKGEQQKFLNIHGRELILVSHAMFSGSRNSLKIINWVVERLNDTKIQDSHCSNKRGNKNSSFTNSGG
jgi:hypothetical protein